MHYIVSLDQGTTSSRAIVFDANCRIVAVDQQEFPQIFPKEGWVEHDPDEIWRSQLSTLRNVVDKAGITPEHIASIGITNQRETTIVWDRNTGRPVYNAIVWQDKRTADYCQKLVNAGVSDEVRDNTGLVIDSYFSASKVRWILDNVQGARERAEAGELCFGTVDTWLLYNLTGGAVHATDVSNASRTMLFNIHDLAWDERMLDLFGIPANLLPEVRESAADFGVLDRSVLGREIPVGGIAGDQQAALFGQVCFEPGMIKNTYGTGCFMLQNIGNKPILNETGILTTVAWSVGGDVSYALEGSVFIAGAAMQWMRDGLGIIQSAEESEMLARSLDDNGDVYFVPALTGLGTPHWDMAARGMLIGITRGTTIQHVVRAGLESIAFQTRDVIKAMELVTEEPPSEIRVDGGAARNNFLLQFQSDLLGIPVIRPEITESTALGAAFLAGIQAGIWDMDRIKSNINVDRVFRPEIGDDLRKAKVARWHEAVERAKGWARD